MIWPEAFIGDCYILLQSLFCTHFHPSGLWKGYCWGNNFLRYLFEILFFQLTGERKSLSKNGIQSQVPSLKVWCNFGMGRVWSRNFWMKFPDICCAEFIVWGISLDITFNQWGSFNHLLSAPAAHGRCLVLDHDPKQWPLGEILLFAHAEEGDSTIPASTSGYFLSLNSLGALPTAGKKKYCQFKV